MSKKSERLFDVHYTPVQVFLQRDQETPSYAHGRIRTKKQRPKNGEANGQRKDGICYSVRCRFCQTVGCVDRVDVAAVAPESDEVSKWRKRYLARDVFGLAGKRHDF